MKWNWFFYTFDQRTRGEVRLRDLALISIKSEETEKTDLDKIIDEFAAWRHGSVVLIKMLCYLKYEKAEYINISMELLSSNTNNTLLALNSFCTIQIAKCVFIFKKSCRLQMQYVVWLFCKFGQPVICIIMIKLLFECFDNLYNKNKWVQK